MMRRPFITLAAALLIATPLAGQVTNDPFPDPIHEGDDVLEVGVVRFAPLPFVAGEAPRPMLLVDEPGTSRMFVNDMWGPIYTLSYDGDVAPYLDIDDARWGVRVNASGRERGFQSFALHPQFGEPGAPGYGKLYTWTDTENTAPQPDYVSGGGGDSHDTVLLEWTARDASAASYDGGRPREVLRIEQPFGNHNGGHIAFNPLAAPGDPDFGMLYVGIADGGSGGDPMDLSQDMGSAFGKIFRIDPLGENGPRGRYGIPRDNPFVGRSGVLGEIYASGVRNPQRFGWDPANGNLFVADIGQNTVEEVSLAPAGADLGWNTWEGSFRYVGREGVEAGEYQGERGLSYPVAEWGHPDPLLLNRSAATGVVVYRHDRIPQLQGLLLFGDFPSGEIFYVSADDLPSGGQDAIRRVLLRDGGQARTLLAVIRDENARQSRERASRADLRFGEGPDGRLFLLNKHDGVIREVVR
jgi:hypothetical protein